MTATRELLEFLIDGLELPNGTHIYVVDLCPDRLVTGMLQFAISIMFFSRDVLALQVQ